MMTLPTTALWLTICLAFFALPASGQTGKVVPKHSEEPLTTGNLTPRYLLQDHRGRAVTYEDFPGRFQLITFGFTSCPDVCPTTLLNFQNILVALGNKAERLQAIFITVDPERDSAELLREYTSAFDPRIIGLTGSPELVKRAAQSFRVSYQKVREPGAQPDIYTMDHSTGMYLLGPDGRFRVKFASIATANEVAERISTLIKNDRSRPLPGR
jgi:protein SCO1/2